MLITSHDRRFIERVANRWWWIDGGQLQEIDGPESVYAAVREGPSAARAVSHTAPASRRPAHETPIDEEAVLARIDALERLLAGERAGKPKFREPALQRGWQEELAALWRQLE